MWLPYTSDIQVKKKTRVYVTYKGGECDVDITDISSILFYGNTCPLPHDFLDLCVKYSVPVCIHRRNMAKAVWITPSTSTTTQEDILSKQIIVRNNQKKSRHITRKLLDAKFKSMEWLIGYPYDFRNPSLTVDDMIRIEARHAKMYWKSYFEKLGYGGSSRRGAPNELKSILDAVSKLASGVLLRYIIYHRMSPYHGFTHTPTDYPSLVYDLIEPYRGYIDKAIFDTLLFARKSGCESSALMGMCISAVEDLFDEEIFVPATRQLATFQELLHGSVLALRAYLQGISRQLIVPIPGIPNGGRPLNVGYRLYGRSAGPTDFWDRAHIAGNAQEKRMSGK